MSAKLPTPPPAYFLSLSLENVRSFGQKQTISFARPDGRPAQWTIILGDNGVGKTTVLKALAALVPVEDPDLKNEPGLKMAFSTRYFEDWKYKWEPTREKSVTSELACGIGLGVYLNPSAYLHSKSIKVEEKVFIEWAEGMLGKQSQGILGYDLSGFCCFGYGAGRTVGNSTIGENEIISNDYASLFDDRANLLDPQEWFLNIDYGSKLAGPEDKSLTEARNRVERMLIDVLPGVTKLQIIATGTPQKPQISLQFLLHDTWVKLRDLSLGYQTLVVWLTDFASKLYVRYPESDNPLAEAAIVLIDEIDLHLHPQWQRELLGELSKISPNTQFIATAHSPLVVQAAGDEGANVVLLRREGDQTVVVKDLEDIRGWRFDQILTSELFGLETARSLRTEASLQRRAELLTKAKRTPAEKKELATLTRELDAEPLGETPSEREVNAVLQELRQRLYPKSSDPKAA